MREHPVRLRRLISDELGECCDADVDGRLASLEALVDAISADYADDLPALRTLGDDTRHRIVRILAAADDERCVCAFDPLLAVTENAISHALSDLVDAEHVARRTEGMWRYDRATDRADRILAALDATRGAEA